MCPKSVGTSHYYTSALQTGSAKLWMLLIGVNRYRDESLPRLRYSAIDCKGLGEALVEATDAFPQREVLIHHDFVPQTPKLAAVRESLAQIVRQAKPQDTVIFYFSGHGLLEPESQQTVLCLNDTRKDDLLHTGLQLLELLNLLNNCAARSQLVWLDACHSGNITLAGAQGKSDDRTMFNPTSQLLDLLRQRAANSKGFYALLSCDRDQHSWEFPDLRHGVFTYFLIRGLRGEAADRHGAINADGLYRYVYHQTIQYIERTNQQLRLENQQKRNRGETSFHLEYSLQTPKRIVEGVGEIVLGMCATETRMLQPRTALFIEGFKSNYNTNVHKNLAKLFTEKGKFELDYLPRSNEPLAEVHQQIGFLLRQWIPTEKESYTNCGIPHEVATLLLYLQGKIEKTPDGESWLVLKDGFRIGRSWLRQELRASKMAQQIIILDCVNSSNLDSWLEDLKIGSKHGQFLLIANSPPEQPDLFARVLQESLESFSSDNSISLAEWIPELQAQLNNLKIVYQLWLWGAQGVIEIIPDLPVEIAPAKPKVTPKTSFNIPVKNICSEVQYLTIEKILTHIVGPVAPCFLATSLNASRDSKTLFKNILERLSFEQRREFERQAEITLSQELEIPTTRSIAIEQKTVSQGSATTQLSIAHTSNSHEFIGRDCSGLTTEQYNYLESLLLELIGPIAPTLLKYYNENSPSIDDLIKSCKEHLNARQQEYFENKIKALPINRTRQQITVEQLKPQTRSGSAFTVLQIEDTFNKQRLIDRETAEECQRYLVNLIGPIAKYIVVDIISKNPAISIERFIELIAAEIPDPKQVEALRQKFLRF
jgi:uncharacterized caspase-like protein